MNSRPLISIVTITYNAADVLQPTLDSVRRRTYQHIEHLIVDGASTDRTLALAEAYRMAVGSAYAVGISSEPDRGIYDAMNKGLRLMKGDYVVFLNAGDTLPHEDTLAAIASAIHPSSSTLPPAVIYGDTNIVDAEGHYLHPRRLRPPKQLTWRSFRWGMLVCHQAFYARADIARRTEYDLQYRHSADVDWCIRVMKEAEREGAPLVNVNTVVANFAEGGDTAQHHRDSLKERYRVMCRHYGSALTLLMHGWFVLRALSTKLSELFCNRQS